MNCCGRHSSQGTALPELPHCTVFLSTGGINGCPAEEGYDRNHKLQSVCRQTAPGFTQDNEGKAFFPIRRAVAGRDGLSPPIAI